MQKRALTDRLVKTVRPPASGRLAIPDAVLPGFELRVTAGGRKSFALRYRVAGRQERVTIGHYPALGLADAREEARGVLRAAEKGLNPADDKRARKAEVGPRDTVRHVAADYIARHARRNTRSWRQTERLLHLYLLPRLADVRLEAVTRRQIRDLVDDVVDAGKAVQANRVLAAVHAMFAWAVEREIVDVNPAAGIKKPTREQARERVLAEAELRAIWQACEGLGYPAGPLVRLLILTGARRDEVRMMGWPEIDRERALWTIPAARAKNGRSHLLPLSRPALALVEALPRFEGCDWLFTTPRSSGPYANLIKPKRRLDRESGVEGWTLHDLRRTVASGMGELGIPGETIARVLNHSEGAIAGVTARYNRADFTEAKRQALEAWGAHVAGGEAANVIRLPA